MEPVIGGVGLKLGGIAVSADGSSLFVTAAADHMIVKVVVEDGSVELLAGSINGNSGFADGPGTTARFNSFDPKH